MLKADADHVKEKIVKFQEISGTRKFSYDDWIEFTLVEKRILELPGKYISKRLSGMEIPPQLLKYTATMLESLESIKKGQASDPDSTKAIRELIAVIRDLVNDPHSFPKETSAASEIGILLKRIKKSLPAAK